MFKKLFKKNTEDEMITGNPYLVEMDDSSITRLIEVEDDEKAEEIYDEMFEALRLNFEDFQVADYVEGYEELVDFGVYDSDKKGTKSYLGDLSEYSFWYDENSDQYLDNLRDEVIKAKNIMRAYCLEYEVKTNCTNPIGDVNYNELLIAGAKYADLETVKEALSKGADINYTDKISYDTAVGHCGFMGHKGTDYWDNEYSDHKKVMDYLIGQGA